MFSEKDMEDAISQNPEKYLGEAGLILLSRQYRIGNYIFDLLFEDRHGAKFIVELQKGVLDRTHTYKILDYYHEFKEKNPTEFIELMVIANRITNERKKRLSDWGVSFKEIPESDFINIGKSSVNSGDIKISTTIKEKENHQIKISGKNSIKWSIDELRKAYAGYSDKNLALKLNKVLDWAMSEGIFMSTTATKPCFGLRGKNMQRIVTFHSNGNIQGYFIKDRFLEGIGEVKNMINETMEVNPLINNDSVEEIQGSRDLTKKVTELSEVELNNLLDIFRKYCD